MDIHLIVKLKSTYEAWHDLFVNDAENRSKICDESKTLAAVIAKSEMIEKNGRLKIVISAAMNIAAQIPRGIPREDYEIFQNDRKIGHVTSGTFSY